MPLMSLLRKALISAAIVLAVIIVGSLVTYTMSKGNNFNLQNLSILNSIYYTIDTLTTNSYGDILPVSAAARAFTIITELVGVSIFIGALTLLSGELMAIHVSKLTGGISDLEAAMLRNHVVLIGTNAINMYLANKLKASKKKFVLLTNSREHYDQLRESGYPIHLVNMSSKPAMERYGIQYASKVVIDMKDSAPAFYAYMIVSELAKPNTKITIVARDSDTEKYFAKVTKDAKVEILNPDESAAMEIIEKE